MIFNVLDYGAVPDGKVVCTSAIQKAIDDAAINGGQVLLTSGTYLSGSLRLRSNVDLHLEEGAVLLSSIDPKDQIDFLKDMEDDNPDTGWEGGCFLFAIHEKNITISGSGKIDGQGRHYFYDDDSDSGYHECPLAVRGLRPRTTYFEDIENLTVNDVTFYDSAFWTLHMAGCRDVLIQGVRILNNERAANNDGIDPDSCQNVVIRDCIIRGGDDSIVIKTTRPITAKYGESRNIIIAGCVLKSRSCALKIGTETWGDIHHIILSDCILEDCNRGFGIFSRDGGKIYDILIHDVTGNTRRFADCTTRFTGIHLWWGKGDPFFISAVRREKDGRVPGTIQNIVIHHIFVTCEGTAVIGGEEDAKVENITIQNSRFLWKRQSAHTPDCIDERPSWRGCYSHETPCLFVRYARNLCIDSDCFKIDENMLPYIHIIREDE
jgi:polygalacturonase